MTVEINKEEFIRVCSESKSMREASIALDIHYNTLIHYAKELGVYRPNKSGKGISKNRVVGVILLSDILEGKHPTYQTYKLKHRMFKDGLKENVCETCGTAGWMGEHLSCELDHIDGDSANHKLENLRILCPNCHSQTSTFRSKKR